MSKVIIDNRSIVSDDLAIRAVLRVMEHGRVSNDGKQYSYATTFDILDSPILVYTDLNKKSDRFVVMDNKQ